MPHPADMLIFAAVVREGSFTRAARTLGVTKQSTSDRVAKLEAELGVRLLERTTRRLRPTDAGATYFERCSAIATQIEEANREVQRLQLEPTGTLRVSAPVLYGRRFLTPVVAAFLAKHPKVRVELALVDRRVNLVDEGFDLAIRVGALDDSTLSARKIGEAHVCFVASPRFLASRGKPKLGKLGELPCITTRPSETWTLGDEQLKVDPILVVNDLEVACEAAIAGVGIARVPALVCREAVERGQLTLLFTSQPPMLQPVYAVFPSRLHLPAKVRVFVDALASLVEPMRPLLRPSSTA
jgi:DNA-binding transcriptional LysR family regulator